MPVLRRQRKWGQRKWGESWFRKGHAKSTLTPISQFLSDWESKNALVGFLDFGSSHRVPTRCRNPPVVTPWRQIPSERRQNR
jgi:hypothetical protein